MDKFDKSSVTIQGVRIQKTDTYLFLKGSIKWSYNTVLQDHKSNKVTALQASSTSSKNCELNIAAALNDNVNVLCDGKQEGKHQRKCRAKYCQVINETFVNKESVRDIDSKVSGIDTISRKQNAVKGT